MIRFLKTIILFLVAETFPGVVHARTVDVRFAFSGRIASLTKKSGDSVKKGQPLASLDRKVLQTELDRQLSDYERQRAEFEIFNLEHPGPFNDIVKYLKTARQARLNASVKDVELAKFHLDQADLISPVEGIVVDNGGNYPGLNVTPASNPFQVLDYSSYSVRLEITQDKLSSFTASRKFTLRFTSPTREIPASSMPHIPGSYSKSTSAKFFIEIPFAFKEDIFPGETVDAVLLD